MRKSQSAAYAYIEKITGPETPEMLKSREFAEQLGLGGISISATEGRLLRFLLGLIKPQKMVEIGTLTGLSCQYFLESLRQDGVIYTLEKSKEHANFSRQALQPWIEKGQVQLIEGDAREELKKLSGPFEAIFIDGNKAAYGEYWDWAVCNISKGGMIVIDNVFLSGAVWSESREAPLSGQKFSAKQIAVMQEMTSKIFNNESQNSVFIPTEEGLIISIKK